MILSLWIKLTSHIEYISTFLGEGLGLYGYQSLTWVLRGAQRLGSLGLWAEDALPPLGTRLVACG